MKNNENSGYGRMINPNGMYYIGFWKHDKMNGQGKMYKDGKLIKDGEWKDDVFVG